MLKSTSNIFEKRKKTIKVSLEKSSQIKESVSDFLKSKFGDSLKGLSLGLIYNSKDNSLTINTENKIIANELTLQLAGMSEFLKSKEIKLNRILIR